MTLRTLLCAAALISGAVCGLTSTLVHQQMVDRVNEALPAEERFDALGWYWRKSQRLQNEYQRLFPEGPLIRRQRFLLGCMIALLVLTIWLLEFESV